MMPDRVLGFRLRLRCGFGVAQTLKEKKQVTIPVRQQSDVINISNATYGKVKAIRSSENSRSNLQAACSRRVELSQAGHWVRTIPRQ